MDQAHIVYLRVARRVCDRSSTTACVPPQKPGFGQRHADQRVEALLKPYARRQRRDYVGAALCVQNTSGVPKVACKRLAVLAVADDSGRRCGQRDMAANRAAVTLQTIVYLSP